MAGKSGTGQSERDRMMSGEREQTPEEILNLILTSDEEKQLKLCTLARDASRQASKCFQEGHTIEIDNLRAHIYDLSVTLMNVINGKPVDPGIVAIAKLSADSSGVVTGGA